MTLLASGVDDQWMATSGQGQGGGQQMLHRYWLWGSVLAVSSLLLNGCVSAGARRHSAAGPPGDSRPPELALDRSEEKQAQAHAHYAAGVIHDVNEETEAALEEFYQAAWADPDNESLVLEVSRRFLQNKQAEKAVELLTRSISRAHASGAIYARLGVAYSQLGKYEQAAQADRVAIKKAPEAITGYQNLVINYLQSKQPTEALKVLDEAAKEPYADADFLINLAELYANFGLQMPKERDAVNAKALAVLIRAEKLKPRNPSLRMKLADGFSQLGDSDRAAQIYLDLLKSLPDLPAVRERVRVKLTDIYLRSQDRKHATEQLEAIIRDDPTNPQYYYLLGSLAFEDKKLAEAADYFSKTILLNPELEQPYYDLASAQIGLNKTSEALATLDQARKKFSQNFLLEFLTGLALSRQKAYGEALQHFTAAEVIAKATDPKRLTEFFYFQLGAASERKGDLDQAETYFEKSLQLAPGFAESLNYLGYMWAEHGLKLEKARDLIEKALKAEPKNAAYLDSMAWVLFKLNQPEAALPYIRQAIELLDEPDATVFDHLGDIYAALKQPDKAREAWGKALALEPNEEIRKKLDAQPAHPPQ